MQLNSFRVASTLVAAVIAGLGVLLAIASQQPPWIDVPPIIVLIAMIANAMLAVVQMQMPSWGESVKLDKLRKRQPPA